MKSNSNLHTTRLLFQLAHHKIECSFLLLLLLISIGEYNASKYGNALYIKEKEIKLGVKICKCVDVGLTDADGVFFICDNADFYVNNNILLHINKFYGYGLSCDSLYALVDIGDNDLISLAFGNAKDVENKSPIITSCKKSDVKWVDVKNVPLHVYYWRFIAFLLSIGVLILISMMIVSFANKIGTVLRRR